MRICPTCKKEFELLDLEDDGSRDECMISGMCQNCQDNTFKEEVYRNHRFSARIIKETTNHVWFSFFCNGALATEAMCLTKEEFACFGECLSLEVKRKEQ